MKLFRKSKKVDCIRINTQDGTLVYLYQNQSFQIQIRQNGDWHHELHLLNFSKLTYVLGSYTNRQRASQVLDELYDCITKKQDYQMPKV